MGRTGMLFLFLILLGAYPVAVAISHHVTSRLPDTVPTQVWADARIGTAIEILERETYFGWATGRPVWHPQSYLTAMPAFQDGITDTLSAFAARRARSEGTAEPDSDLRHAQSLLSQLEGEEAETRAYAAIEALRRFDGRKARALTSELKTEQVLRDDLELISQLISVETENLRKTAAQASRGVFNREDVRLFYHAKGTLFACGMILRAYKPDEVELPGYRQALVQANTAFERANKPAPLTVSNTQPGEFSLGGNDMMQLAWLANEAQSSVDRLLSLLVSTQKPEQDDH